jgi:hypothetical protein
MDLPPKDNTRKALEIKLIRAWEEIATTGSRLARLSVNPDGTWRSVTRPTG